MGIVLDVEMIPQEKLISIRTRKDNMTLTSVRDVIRMGYVVKMTTSDITNRIKERIFEEFKNPYPKDIFSWDNKKKITLTRGRFHEFIHNVVENTKKDIIKIIDNSD